MQCSSLILSFPFNQWRIEYLRVTISLLDRFSGNFDKARLGRDWRINASQFQSKVNIQSVWTTKLDLIAFAHPKKPWT